MHSHLSKQAYSRRLFCLRRASRAFAPAGQTAAAVWLAALTAVGRLVGRQIPRDPSSLLRSYAVAG